MAVTVAAVYAGTYSKTWNVIAGADGDTSATISHGFAAVPQLIGLVPLLPIAYTAQWVLSTVNASVIILGKTSAGTSSSTSAQLLVKAELPHSFVA
jgi:hypothetical protein